jgi:HSP20 family molecular chaperone IbpA
MSDVQTVKRRAGEQLAASIIPAVDVIEDSAGITLYADLPGVSKDKLTLHVEHDALVIEAAIDSAIPPGIELQHAEIDAAAYRRVFTLSKELDVEKISAQVTNGVLKLHIPKAEHAQPKRINVVVN